MPERTHTCLIPCSILQKEIDRAELDSLCFGAKSMLSYSNQLDKNMLPEGTTYHQSQLKQNELCRVLTHITSSKFMLNLKLCSCVLCSQLNGINQVLACRWLESEDMTFAAKLQFKELQESSLNNNLGRVVLLNDLQTHMLGVKQTAVGSSFTQKKFDQKDRN